MCSVRSMRGQNTVSRHICTSQTSAGTRPIVSFLKAQQLSEVDQKIQLVLFLEAQQLSQVDQKIQLVSFLEAQQFSQVDQKIQLVTDQCLKSQAQSNMCFGRP